MPPGYQGPSRAGCPRQRPLLRTAGPGPAPCARAARPAGMWGRPGRPSARPTLRDAKRAERSDLPKTLGPAPSPRARAQSARPARHGLEPDAARPSPSAPVPSVVRASSPSKCRPRYRPSGRLVRGPRSRPCSHRRAVRPRPRNARRRPLAAPPERRRDRSPPARRCGSASARSFRPWGSRRGARHRRCAGTRPSIRECAAPVPHRRSRPGKTRRSGPHSRTAPDSRPRSANRRRDG